jgi:hypothetical protein
MQVLGRADRLVGLVVLGEGEHDIARVAQDRYAQGRGSQQEVYKAEVENTRLATELVCLEAKRRGAAARLTNASTRSPADHRFHFRRFPWERRLGSGTSLGAAPYSGRRVDHRGSLFRVAKSKRMDPRTLPVCTGKGRVAVRIGACASVPGSVEHLDRSTGRAGPATADASGGTRGCRVHHRACTAGDHGRLPICGRRRARQLICANRTSIKSHIASSIGPPPTKRAGGLRPPSCSTAVSKRCPLLHAMSPAWPTPHPR